MFSMNPNPASWVALDAGELAFDQYPDGSFQFRVTNLPPMTADDLPTVLLKSTLPQAIMAAAQVVDALSNIRESQAYPVRLVIQTVPDQRGDKQGKDGACLSARVTARMLGSVTNGDIVVHDVHSSQTLQWLQESVRGSLYHVDALECFKRSGLVVGSEPKVVQVDAGARRRVRQWADAYDADIICMDKARDADGKIIGHKFTDDPMSLLTTLRRDHEVWVIDDLCDGGATFISVATALRSEFPDWRGKLHLYVTHGLFSKGRTELLSHYDSVTALFSYDDWRS